MSSFNDIVEKTKDLDFLFIEKDIRSQYVRFHNQVSYFDIFQCLRSKVLYISVDLDLLPQLFQMYMETDYEFKALIPSISVLPNEDIEYTLQNRFHVPLFYIAVFELPHCGVIRDMGREVNLVIDRTSVWQEKVIDEHLKKGHAGMLWDQYGLHKLQIHNDRPIEGHRKELF